MFKRNLIAIGVFLATLVGLLSVVVSPVSGQPPDNDERADATIISALPFNEQLDTSEATQGSNDPYVWCDDDYYYYSGTPQATVWYEMTPTESLAIQASTAGSNYDTILVVFDRWNNQIDCAIGESSLITTLDANEPYTFLVGDRSENPYPDPYPSPEPGAGGLLVFSVEQVPGPDHDHFADAIAIDAVPFEHSFALTGATGEAQEPRSSCNWNDQRGTAWYAFTPTIDGSYSAELRDLSFYAYQSVYTGNSLQNLDELACRNGDQMLTIQATVGTTYYFQVGNVYSWDNLESVRFSLDAAPPPVADFWYWPDRPSMYDEVHFEGYYSHDPANIGIETYLWNFGDGTSSDGSDCCPDHRFPGDGEYQVVLTVITYDGRSDTTTRSVVVQTHDVAITKFSVPKSAKAGQTRPISVGIRNHQYPERVTVRLYRSVPGGYEYLGNWTQEVPVRKGNRTTDIDFSYTFTEADATQGKVTFKAEVDIYNFPDALPADNVAISPPTKVQ